MSNSIKFLVSDTVLGKPLPSLAMDILTAKLYKKEGILKELVRAIAFAYLENGSRSLKNKYSWMHNGVKHSRPRYIIVLAYHDNIPIGCMVMNSFFSNVYVHQDYRNKGIATELFNHAAYNYDLKQKVLNTGLGFPVRKLISSLGLSTRMKELSKLTNLPFGNISNEQRASYLGLIKVAVKK